MLCMGRSEGGGWWFCAGGNNLPIVELIFVTRRTFRVAEASFVVAASRFSAGGGFG